MSPYFLLHSVYVRYGAIWFNLYATPRNGKLHGPGGISLQWWWKIIFLRVLANYKPEIVKICILACNSANKPPLQNLTKDLFLYLWSIGQKGFLSDFEKMVH